MGRYCRRSDWVIILATRWSGSGQDIWLIVDLCGGNSFTISVLVCGVNSRNTKICWRERGSWGKGISYFELAGNLKRLLSFSCSLLLFHLLLLPSFIVFRSTSGSTSFLKCLFLTVSGSRYISISIAIAISIVVIGVGMTACRFALRVFLFARFP